MDAFRLPSGEPVSRLGQGAWQIAENRARYAAELAALRLGLDLGLALIDTAEMYGGGRSEQLVAEAIAGRRERVYVVSKVLPSNATRRGTIAACERSLKRLGTDYLDLYLLHWRDTQPLDETLEAFVALRQRGSIRHYGVSNFDVADMREAEALAGGSEIATNQVLYNLERRGVEWDLLPRCRERGIPLMAYSPLGSSGAHLLDSNALRAVAARHAATPARVALAWLLRQPDVVVIPKASSEAHVRDNHAALELRLTPDDLAELDGEFPPPRRAGRLEMI
jgi:diketogulonate reductase-like aldo/keto reductase